MCHLYRLVYNVHKSLLIMCMCKCFFMSHPDFFGHVAVTRMWCACFHDTKKCEFPSSFFVYSTRDPSRNYVLMLLFLLFCLSQAAPFQRPIRHAHGVVSQRHQRLRLRLAHPRSLSEWRPLSGKALLFGMLAYLKGFDPPCVAFTTDEMPSRRDEDSVCHLTKTRYWWADIVTWLFEN